MPWRLRDEFPRDGPRVLGASRRSASAAPAWTRLDARPRALRDRARLRGDGHHALRDARAVPPDDAAVAAMAPRARVHQRVLRAGGRDRAARAAARAASGARARTAAAGGVP